MEGKQPGYLKERGAMERHLREEAFKRGIGVGEMVKKVTDYLGIKQCPRCVRWQKFLDQYRVGAIPWDRL